MLLNGYDAVRNWTIQLKWRQLFDELEKNAFDVNDIALKMRIIKLFGKEGGKRKKKMIAFLQKHLLLAQKTLFNSEQKKL